MVVGSVLAGATSCGPVCHPIASEPTSICSSGGEIQAGASFAIRAFPAANGGKCDVRVNGSEITLTLSGCSYYGSPAATAVRPAPPSPVTCQIPALAPGTYTVVGTGQSIVVPASGGTQLDQCP